MTADTEPRPRRFAAALAVVLVAAPAAGAQEPPGAATEPLVVGTRDAPPFSIRGEDGSWSGIAIELWQEIAADLGLGYRLEEEADLETLLARVRRGGLAVVAAPITMTAEREEQLDFSHPFHVSGLAIAARDEPGAGILRALRRFPWLGFLELLGGLLVALLASGLLVWSFERRRNPEQFGGKGLNGLLSGVWWSAVTMTTVGYGDKAPRTFAGRLVAVVWMFASIFMIATFTAAMASTLTAASLESAIRGPEDLPGLRVATVGGSTSDAYLTEHRVRADGHPSAAAALEAVARGRADAAVYDAPILRYLVAKEHSGRLVVLPRTFSPQRYAIALPPGSPLREAINRSLLEVLDRSTWQETLERYIGK